MMPLAYIIGNVELVDQGVRIITRAALHQAVIEAGQWVTLLVGQLAGTAIGLSVVLGAG